MKLRCPKCTGILPYHMTWCSTSNPRIRFIRPPTIKQADMWKEFKEGSIVLLKTTRGTYYSAIQDHVFEGGEKIGLDLLMLQYVPNDPKHTATELFLLEHNNIHNAKEYRILRSLQLASKDNTSTSLTNLRKRALLCDNDYGSEPRGI